MSVIETVNVQNVPKTLNGYPVAMATPHENGYVTVLVKRKDDPIPYVIATYWPELGTSWSWGHYIAEAEKAVDVFYEVADRNANRGNIH